MGVQSCVLRIAWSLARRGKGREGEIAGNRGEGNEGVKNSEGNRDEGVRGARGMRGMRETRGTGWWLRV